MRHRHFSTPFNAPPIDQHECNHLPPEQSYIPMGRSVAPENNSFVCPVDHVPRGGVPSNSQWASEGRANEYPSSSPNMEVQHVTPSFTGPLYDPYPRSSVSGSLSLGPANNVGHVHASRYNRLPIRDVEVGPSNSTTSAVHVSFKRKSPDIPRNCERGSSSSRFYTPGSSSSSSQMLMEKSSADCHSIPHGSLSVPPYRGSSLSIAGEDSARNVRSRSRLELEPITARSHLLSYSSHHYHLTTRPVNHSGQVQSANLNADATSREWNSVPLYAPATQGMITTPDINGSSHEANQFLVGGTDADIGGCHHENVFSRHSVSSSLYLQSHHAQVAREGRNHSRRATPSYRTGSNYSHLGHGTASSTNAQHPSSESLSSRYSRHSPAGGWRNSYRNGRPRISVERFQPIAGVVDAHDRIEPEAMMMVDHAAFYGGSRNFLDQHRDMRLDIDNMSYEELLALEERIGTVSTGLSEDRMSMWLMEKVHYSSDRSHEEPSCAICLEEYKNGEKVGSMKKCGHDFHVDCIKKWLSLKKVCPICKTECSS